MSASTFEHASVLTGRQMVFLGVVGLHALVIGALMTMRIAIDGPKPLSVFKPVTSVPVEPEPPQPRPQLEPAEVRPQLVIPSMPVPRIPVEEFQWAPPDTGIVLGPAEGIVIAGGDVGTVPEVPATELQYRATRSPDDYYPAISLQLQEQGTAVVRVCVTPSGRLDGRPTIERGSGSRHLDAAAIQWAREALAFTPATRNGAAVAACKGFRVNFRLR